jgi:acyl-CoA thioesterase-1
MPNRRLVLSGLSSAAAFPAAAASRPPVITVLGDSLTSGWGLTPTTALPAQLRTELSRIGVQATVRGDGVPGDTSAGGLSRVGQVYRDTDVCVVMLGANDFLLSVDPRETERNLDAIVRRLRARKIDVVLAAGQSPRRQRNAYDAAFDRVFPTVARRNGVPLAPNLLGGVIDRPSLLQPDRLHPNAQGVRVIASRLAPVVAKALRQTA